MSSPFRYCAFRRLFAAQVVSLAGTGVTTIALALLAWEMGGAASAKILGTVFAIKMVIYVLLAPVMAALAKGLPVKRWLIGLDLVRMVLVLCLPWVSALWQLYAIMGVVFVCSAGFTPVYQATIADIVTEGSAYQRALSFSRMAFNAEQLLSPLLTAGLLGILSLHGLFVLDALSFFVSAALVFLTVLPCSPSTQKASSPSTMSSMAKKTQLSDIWFGLEIYIKTPRLRGVLWLYLSVAAASAMVIINTVVYVRDVLGGTDRAASVAYLASGMGAIVAAYCLPRLLGTKSPLNLMVGGAALLAAGLWCTALLPGWAGFVLLWCVLGVGLSLVQTPVGALIRRSCREEDSPAVFAAQFSLSHACWLLAYSLAGYVAGEYGVGAASVVLAGLATVGCVGGLSLVRQSDTEIIEHTHASPSEAHHHTHAHEHGEGADTIRHAHTFVIDRNHRHWPSASA